MNSLNNKLFFIIFFIAIVASLIVTYKTIVVEKNYTTFSDEDDIPRPSEFYLDLISNIQ